MRQRRRRALAKMPFEWKVRELVRMQRINFELKKAAGRKAPRPWFMSEAEYQQEMEEVQLG